MSKWEMVKLGEVCRPKQWKTISGNLLQENGYPVYGANGIIGYYSEYTHECETLLVGCRGTCGSLNICSPFSYINGNAMALDNLINSVNIKFLYYFLENRGFSDVVSGSSQPQIIKTAIEQILIPIPPLDKQKRIAEELDKISGLIAKRTIQLEKLDLLVKAKFVEMFGDPVTNPMGWEIIHLSYCLNKIENGKSFVCESHSRTNDQPAILKLSAVTYGVYKEAENKAIIDENTFVVSAEVHSNDLLFTRKNTPELVGMSAYVFSTAPKLMMPDLIFRFNTNENCNKIYLWKLINHDLFRPRIMALASGSAKSMSNISKEKLSALEITLPPINLQNQFADYVVNVEQTKNKLQQGLGQLETLYKARMQEYFE